ncbi:helix-turn-helix domain-containing protein [Levilactobacillus cerevisiae]|uniref:helix-turn-helix domain-containing protein n=1 Tax=Levilactobacillus cerevisiae TaxID=1704076 RepID=UPI000F79CA86|nr:helix-turn-helix domain-containing protein [Levilactobacillus cerevisiae]
MPNQQAFFNPETERTEIYTEKWLEETCTVKELTDLSVRHHYWEGPDGELWGDFNDPMENVRRDFQAYRERQHFLTPPEIIHVRQRLNLTVRAFAAALGLGVSTVSQIENGERLQTKYQDNLFRWAQGDRFSPTPHLKKRA